MAANTTPIFSRLGSIGTVPAVTAANTTKDLTSGTIYLVFTADATNGSRISQLIWHPLGTNTATAGRVWINNGSTTATAANNALYRDVTLAGTTNSEVAGLTQTVMVMDVALPAGYRIYVTIGTAVAAGFSVTVIGGLY